MRSLNSTAVETFAMFQVFTYAQRHQQFRIDR